MAQNNTFSWSAEARRQAANLTSIALTALLSALITYLQAQVGALLDAKAASNPVAMSAAVGSVLRAAHISLSSKNNNA